MTALVQSWLGTSVGLSPIAGSLVIIFCVEISDYQQRVQSYSSMSYEARFLAQIHLIGRSAGR